jgi:hypothetical protein
MKILSSFGWKNVAPSKFHIYSYETLTVRFYQEAFPYGIAGIDL